MAATEGPSSEGPPTSPPEECPWASRHTCVSSLACPSGVRIRPEPLCPPPDPSALPGSRSSGLHRGRAPYPQSWSVCGREPDPSHPCRAVPPSLVLGRLPAGHRPPKTRTATTPLRGRLQEVLLEWGGTVCLWDPDKRGQERREEAPPSLPGLRGGAASSDGQPGAQARALEYRGCAAQPQTGEKTWAT